MPRKPKRMKRAKKREKKPAGSSQQKKPHSTLALPHAAKQELFFRYVAAKESLPSYTIENFLSSGLANDIWHYPPYVLKPHKSLPEKPQRSSLSLSTMARIIQTAIEEKWPGSDRISGRCKKHPKIKLDGNRCFVCDAIELVKKHAPQLLAIPGEPREAPRSRAAPEDTWAWIGEQLLDEPVSLPTTH